ncbi:MAG TPA: HAMP domain-containing sensor histidine kinase, partial [Candidatus Nitrosotalea sp.]|nr:HAMP domain-containing sensor histidine kinase [Candidatus Nitrosotalea sp.]
MAAVTGWPTSSGGVGAPSDLERRLLLSYAVVFISVVALFALAVHGAFAVVFAREAADRLRTMVKTGESVVDSTRAGISIDLGDQTIRALDPRIEGLRWRDHSGRTLAAYGLSTGNDATSETGTPAEHGVRVEAILSRAPYALRLRSVDFGILGSLLFAVAGSLVAGRWLTHRIVVRLQTNLKIMQEFTADAAHELRGPLTAIATNAGSAVPAASGKFLIERHAMDSIASATAQMIRVTEDLLTLARANQSLELELFVVDLDESVPRVVELYRDLATAKGVALEATIVEPARIYGNPDQIDRIVGNLVRNAIEYTQTGGTVSVACAKDRGGSHIIVTDTGVGIAPEDLEHIF